MGNIEGFVSISTALIFTLRSFVEVILFLKHAFDFLGFGVPWSSEFWAQAEIKSKRLYYINIYNMLLK